MKAMDADWVFVDTHILLAATDVARQGHVDAVEFLSSPPGRLALSGQVLREYLVVATRPVEVNGLGMSASDALGNVAQFRARCRSLEENDMVLEVLYQLVSTLDLKGKRIHDANIAATMLAHGLRRLATFNPKDFAAFERLSFVQILK